MGRSYIPATDRKVVGLDGGPQDATHRFGERRELRFDAVPVVDQKAQGLRLFGVVGNDAKALPLAGLVASAGF